MINNRLAAREGAVGNFFKLLEIGERQYGKHSFGNYIKFVNWTYIRGAQAISARRMVLSRMLGITGGALNYSALFVYCFATVYILNRFRFIRSRDVLKFNY